MQGNGRPLVPYLRQSRAKERTISIDEQRRDIARWADANGVTLAPEVVEQGMSGSKPWRERALGAAVDAELHRLGHDVKAPAKRAERRV